MPMRSKACHSLLVLFALASTACATELRIGSAQVQIAAAAAGALRLTVSYDRSPDAQHSVFLADTTNKPFVQSERAWVGDLIGVKTTAGELLIDPHDGRWTLRDIGGNAIVTGQLGGLTRDRQTNQPVVKITINRDAQRIDHFYGSGDAGPGLRHIMGRSAVGGGRAVIPYYWSDSGYAAMAVTSDDNSPATWDGRSADSLTWQFPGRTADLYLMPATDFYAAARAYAELSGFPAVPPRWTFGYLQCRWGWKDRAYIDDAMRQFIDRKLPVDAFIFDFEWFTPKPDYELTSKGRPDYQDFSWNPLLFPDPVRQIAELKKNGIHVVGIRKPRLGNSDAVALMRSKGWGLPLGRGVDARCLDFRNADCRAWYAKQLIPLLKAGIDGWWDDEGEISFTEYYWWNQAEAQALAGVNPALRLWTVDRSFEPGLQRFGAAAWTADIPSDWPTLAATPGHLLNWSLAGMDYGTCDIGGFLGNDTPELLTRWMQMGVFMPVMRTHSVLTVKPRFPWLYGPAAEDAIRKALELRYRLVPYYYSLAHQAHETGAPLMRPLVMEFPTDPNVADMTSQWLIGSGLMAAPILSPGNSRSVYLPDAEWYEFDTSRRVEGNRFISTTAALDQIPIYVRAGTILPLASPIQHTSELPGGPLDLQVYPGKDADFTLVEDDGQTTGYLDGQIRRTAFHWDDVARELSWKIIGPYRGEDIFRTIKVEVFNGDEPKIAQGSLASDADVVIPR
jgi:alpha-glucosidase